MSDEGRPSDRRPLPDGAGGLYLEILGDDVFSSATASDARVWIRAYRDLLEVVEPALARVHEMLPAMNPTSRWVSDQTDVPVIEADVRRLRYRLAIWERRLANLDGTHA